MGKVKDNNNNDKNAMWTGCVIRVFEVVKFVSIFHSLFLYKWKWKLLYLCAPLMMSQSNSQCFVTSHGRLYDYRENIESESNNAFWRLFLGKSELMPDLSEQRSRALAEQWACDEGLNGGGENTEMSWSGHKVKRRTVEQSEM